MVSQKLELKKVPQVLRIDRRSVPTGVGSEDHDVHINFVVA
jgi:hypothetical protein